MLTIKQKMLLEAIQWFIDKNGYSPTIRELASLLECDTRPVFDKLMKLEEKGYIKTTNGKARSIQVIRGVDNDTEDKETNN